MKNTTIHQISIEDYKKLIDSIDDFSSTIESSRALPLSIFLNADLLWDESTKKWIYCLRKTKDGELLEIVSVGVINFSEKVKNEFEKEKVMDSPLLSNIQKTMLIDYYYNKTDNKDYIVDDRDLLEKITSNTK